MATTRAALTDEDIRALLKGASADDRAAAARKICTKLEQSALTDDDRAMAAEILRIMAVDAAELVRRALAATLKSSSLVPRDVALTLARDVENVCLPMLAFSPVFTDDDLAEIVRLGGKVRQLAIARRSTLPRTVTNALAQVGSERAVATACANDRADFGETALQKIVDRFETSERVLTAVAYRAVLPLSVSGRLVKLVGDQVREHLMNQNQVSADVAVQLTFGAAERANADLVVQTGQTSDLKDFVAHLHQDGMLTASLLLRALAQGHMAFFEWGIAELAAVPHHRTWLMVHDAGPLGLKAIYERAGLPARLFDAFRVGVDTYHSMEFDGGIRDRERFQQRMMQRFLTSAQPAGEGDVDYLLDKLDQAADRGRAEGFAESA